MNHQIPSICRVFHWVFLSCSVVFPLVVQAAVPGSINIQGTLQPPGGGPLVGTYTCRIRFLDQDTGGQDIGSVTQAIQLSEAGRFSIQVTPPQALLDTVRPGYELSVDVDGDGFDAGDIFPNLVTIQSVPFALKAGDSDSLGGQTATDFATDAELTAGLAEAATSGHNHDSVYWGLAGNEAEFGQFLGTTNDQSLQFRTNNQTALRLIPNATSPSVIGGYQSNNLFAGVAGGVIAGGGTSNYHGTGSFSRNQLSGDYGAIVGGTENRAGEYAFVGGGDDNQALGKYSMVGGGAFNRSSNTSATVGGGDHNVASGFQSTISGGKYNTASGQWSTVAGGESGVASGSYSTVAGGVENSATANFTFAAGHFSNAVHEGSFVWSDAPEEGLDFTLFSSKVENEFAIQAQNGLRLSEDAPPEKKVAFGEYYRDNSILAWAKVSAGGIVNASHGVVSVAHVADSGIYTLTVTDGAEDANALIPTANAEIDTAPEAASDLRIVSINQKNTAPFKTFDVFINRGTGALVDNDFVFMVTGR